MGATTRMRSNDLNVELKVTRGFRPLIGKLQVERIPIFEASGPPFGTVNFYKTGFALADPFPLRRTVA